MKLKQLAVAIASLGCLSGAAQAGELEEMKAMLQKLQARIEQLEAQKAAPAAKVGAPVVTQGNPSLIANSNVTLYGKIDVFTEYDTHGGKGTRFALDSGGMNGSRWGVKGGADINKDLRAIYQVEGGFLVNKGSSTQGGLLFGRQAYAGVQGNFGTLTAGRQYGVFYNATQTYDPFEQGYGSPTNSGQFDSGPVRYDTSIIYASPKFGDFSANGMVALGNQTGPNKRDATAVALNYNPGAFGATLSHQKDDHIASAAEVRKWTFVGAGYQLGNTRVMGGISHKETNTDAGVNTKRKEWMIGSKSKMTPSGSLLAVYGRGKTDNVDDKSGALAVGWIEAMSPQTNVYGVVSNHTNGALSANVPQGTSSSGAYSINNGDSALGVALGFQYSF